jgi:hypothetical protein
MRVAALVLGCIGGGLLLLAGLLTVAVHPYGFVFIVAGGITARTATALGATFLSLALLPTLAPFFVNFAAAVSPAYFYSCGLLLALAMILAVAAPEPM